MNCNNKNGCSGQCHNNKKSSCNEKHDCSKGKDKSKKSSNRVVNSDKKTDAKETKKK